LTERYPLIRSKLIASVIQKSHSDLAGVKKIVDPMPELAKAVWERKTNDCESAIGAASHVGRRDIALYLIDKGAPPSLFTYAMLGKFEAVQAMVDQFPHIHTQLGPHGMSLLAHAYAGERMLNWMNKEEINGLK
jgi:hypothetical protein